MRIKFDDRLEKYLFFFVIVWVVFATLGWRSLSSMFFTLFPLIMVYLIPWKKTESFNFSLHENRVVYFFYLYIFFRIFSNSVQIVLNPGKLSASAPSVPAILAREVLPRVSDVLLILLIVKAERQRFRTIGITRDNLVTSLALLVMPLCAVFFFRQGSPQEALLVEGVSYPWAGVAIALAVGVHEEILFRGFPLFRLENLGTGKALLITAVAFALIHLPQSLLGNEMLIETLLHLINPFANGIVFALVLSKTRNILPGILLHAFVDMPFFI